MKARTLLVGICMVSAIFSFGQHDPTDPKGDSAADIAASTINIFAPNAFTPDGDYRNDSWKVFMNRIDIYDFRLTIYDRTGQLIWESYDVNAEWDGSFGGNNVPAGIYVWMVDTKDAETNTRFQQDGFINVIR